MKSLKTQFTVFFTVTIFIVVLLFSLVLFSTTVAQARIPITENDLLELTHDRPTVREFIQRTRELERIQDIGEIIAENTSNRFAVTLLIIIPPILLLSSVVAYLLASYLVKPIGRISSSLREMGKDNLSKRVPELHNSEEMEILSTRFNELMDELEEAFTAQEQFIGDAAHELRTPLAAMKTNLQVFRDSEKKTKKDYVKLIEVVERLNGELIHLNEKLLFLNRGSQGKIAYESVDLIGLAEDVIENLTPLAKKKNVTLKLMKPKESVKLQADPQEMSIVIKNLLENGIKYSKKDQTGLVKLILSRQKSFVRLEVQDDGVGIPETDLSKIFGRFYRGENGYKVTNEGIGLGLSIVQKIVQAYGGSIEVESEVGVGSKFVVELQV